ncbi:cyclic AMP-dependent transcription factor ATF-4 [Trichonephila inaurata madagascariensis]|uniref:Cyclic AMP-dependent transcription factor ATF-4 n=1 Tax=Trichonephila inaurata madagascariensis TaxID=2747483 RepID=A0A8X7BYD9_9ARAC|nr:cyclic AMP-dependent transcription factor ATF-4 [Trichonephila inaurata madagascariensis]
MAKYEQSSWDGWLEDAATLFPTAKPNDILNLDELFYDKANNDVNLGTGLDGLNWLDEKVDLSVLDCSPATEEEYAILNDFFNLLDQPANNIDSPCLSPDLKSESNIGLEDIIHITQNQPDPLINIQIPSPCYEAISESNSPESFVNISEEQSTTSNKFCFSPGKMGGSPPSQVVPVEFCLSPGQMPYSSSPERKLSSDDVCLSPNNNAYWSISGESTSNDFCQSPSYSNLSGTIDDPSVFQVNSSTSSDDENVKSDSTVSVILCEISPETILETKEALSIDEVTNSVKKRKFVNNGKEIPKIKVSLKNVFQPYSKPEGRRLNKNDRKKVQNKEAAARYRMKKRNEANEIMSEVSILESEQQKLKEKHDSLLGEIKYLKSLMCEILTKKGIMK